MRGPTRPKDNRVRRLAVTQNAGLGSVRHGSAVGRGGLVGAAVLVGVREGIAVGVGVAPDGRAVGRTVALGRGVGRSVGRSVGARVAVGRRVTVGSGAGMPGTRRTSPAPERPASRIGWSRSSYATTRWTTFGGVSS